MKNGWDKDNNTWKYYKNGDIVTNKNILSNGLSYYVDNEGNMVTGQHFIDGKRRVFNTNGQYEGAELLINDVKGVKIL